jgi:hypothetical protein
MPDKHEVISSILIRPKPVDFVAPAKGVTVVLLINVTDADRIYKALLYRLHNYVEYGISGPFLRY